MRAFSYGRRAVKHDERVLCIPEPHFRAVGHFTGFRPADDAYRTALLDRAAYTYQPRSTCETDPAFKQLIPYVVLTCGDLVFHYRRGGGGTEARLRAKRSVGIGGHINDRDAGSEDPFFTGMWRELYEEVDLGSGFSDRLFGFIYDPSTRVGEVHLGVVYRLELLPPPDVIPLEDAITDGGFAPVTELLADAPSFETWSQLVLAAL